jgi:uncharacterized repeat protein (TIGR01451 family)
MPLSADNELKVSTKLLEQVGKSANILKSLNEAIPEAIVAYEHTLSNPTATLATDLVFTDIVPEHTTFVKGSADCDRCTILYSVDGEVFEKASELFTYQSGTLRIAHPEEYRHIRWIINILEPHSQQTIIFKTQID